MIRIKNTKIFKCDINCNFHWLKLPKMINIMRNNILDLRNTDLRYANLRYANLCNAILRNANLRYADLYNADLRNADLYNADLYNANLRYANLCNAILRNANLRYANLYNADLRNADLYGAKLKPINEKEIIIKDFMSVTDLGSQNRQTLIFNTNIGIVIQCGCFYGTEKEFKKKVEETHKGTNYEKEYLEMIKLAKIRFKRGKECVY